MPIRAPGPRLNPSIQRRSGGRKSVDAGLALTSMVDMFAIMVIFLLQSFSSEGELIVLPSGMELPEVKNIGQLERAPSIVISREEILFNGEKLAATEEVFYQDAWNIPALQDALTEFRKNQEAEAIVTRALDEESAKAREKINISADKRLEFEVVKKVIYTAGFAGFPDFRFAVFSAPGAERVPEEFDGRRPDEVED